MALLCELWKFPSLAKEGWRVAPGWFETMIPQIRAEILNSTEQLSLAVYLIENVKQSSSISFSPRRQWSEIRGLASPTLWDEDAQSAISKMRQESDGHREARKQS